MAGPGKLGKLGQGKDHSDQAGRQKADLKVGVPDSVTNSFTIWYMSLPPSLGVLDLCQRLGLQWGR